MVRDACRMGYGLMLALRVHQGAAGLEPPFTFTVTTTGAQSVTIKRMTPRRNTWVDWGDGSAIAAVSAGYTGTLTHAYAGAGTWNVRYGTRDITYLDWRDAKLGGLNTNQLRRARFETFYLENLPSASITLDSADMASWGVSYQFLLYILPSTGITLDTADMVGWGLSNALILYAIPSATITLDGTDMLAWNSPDEIRINNCGLSSAAVTQAILGAWGLRNLMAHSTPVLNIGGASNAVPGGAYADEDPPSTDLGYIYELVNDPESEGFYKWAVVWNGGSAP